MTTYTYDPAGNRASVTDAENHPTTYDYDALNRVITTTNALGGQTIVTYDAVGNRTYISDPKSQLTTFTYDSLYRLTGTTNAENETTTVTYDALGNRLSQTDPENHTTTSTYDSLGRVIQTTNPLSGTNRVTYDALGNRLSVTDANNHTTTFVYDDLNRLVQTTDPNNLVTTVRYDGLGNRLSTTNGAGETTTFEYDAANRLTAIRYPLSAITTYRYNGVGSRVGLVDAEGVETRYEYDNLDRLAAVVENYKDGVYTPGVTDEDVRTEYDYDAVGNRLSVTDARNNTTTYTYDELNRRTEQRDPLSHLTTYGYDAAGNRTRLADANGVITTLSYDNANRLTGIDYSDSTPDVSFTYDDAGNRLSMSDGTGTTTYDYDDLYRLTQVSQPAGSGQSAVISYQYDAVGNRTNLIYPDNRVVTYTYDLGNRLEAVEDWRNGQFGYDYDDANRLTGLTLPNGVESSYDYDEAGRLTLLAHTNITETLASYTYDLDNVGNRRTLTETLVAVQNLPAGTFLESDGQVVMEAEHFGQTVSDTTHAWLTQTVQSGYTGTAYLQAWPDTDALYLSDGPKAEYPIHFTTPGTYTLWLRGYPTNAAGDSVYADLAGQVVTLTGFAPNTWGWASGAATLAVSRTGVYTLDLRLREDGLRIDRLLLTTDTTYLPTGFGPAETERQAADVPGLLTVVDHTINYDYDNLYRLTSAAYSTGEDYGYSYDPVGNRLQQIINGDTTDYLYDAANRLEQVSYQSTVISYQFDANGNLLTTGVMTNTWDAANRLVSAQRITTTLQPIYNGVGDRVGQTVDLTTTYFALDVQGLPEVIYTSEGNAYLHLPGVIMAASAESEVRYLLSDGLGSIRQAVDDTGAVISYHEFDPYGNPVDNEGGEPYGYTGEWWVGYINLLHLRARWYAPGEGIFLSRDAVEGEPAYQYVSGNPVNLADPSGKTPSCSGRSCGPDVTDWLRVEVAMHVAYGKQVKAAYDDMWWQMANGLATSLPFPLLAPKLKDLDTSYPFGEIINNLDGLGYFSGLASVEAAGIIEYGIYGLAIDYSSFDFYNESLRPKKDSCGSPFCDLGRLSNERHQSVTLCGKCIDASDIGNLMFGVGGATRGYSQNSVWSLASLFNLRDDLSIAAMANEDPRASPVGWMIVATEAYYSKESFCAVLSQGDERYGGIHEDALHASQCPACQSDYLSPILGHRSTSDLLNNSVSGHAHPLEWFKTQFYPPTAIWNLTNN